MSERDVAILRSLAERIDPEDAGAHNNLGVVFFQKGLLEDALSAFERALELEPRLEVARTNAAIALQRGGLFEARVERLREALDPDPENAELRDALARTCLLGGDPAGAAREWGRLLAVRPDSTALHMKLAYAEAERGESRRALDLLERAVELEPGEPAIRLQLAELLHRMGLPVRAEVELRRVLAARPRLARAHLFLSKILAESGRSEAAEAARLRVQELDPELLRSEQHLSLDRYRTAPDTPSRPSAARTGGRRGEDRRPASGAAEAPGAGGAGDAPSGDGQTAAGADRTPPAFSRLSRAIELRQDGDLDGAARELERAIAAGEEEAQARQDLAEIRLLQGRPDGALPLYSALLEAVDDSPKLWNERGVAHHRIGRLREALSDYRRAVALDPGYGLGWSNLGVALAQAGDTAAAERALLQAAGKAAPPEILWNLGLFLALERREDEAAEVYREAVQRDPGSARSWSRLGATLFQAGRAEEAREALLEAVDRDPELAEARYQLGFVLSALGDFKGALRETQRGLEREPVLPTPRYLLLIDVQFEGASIPAPDADEGRGLEAGSSLETFRVETEVLERTFSEMEAALSAEVADSREMEAALSRAESAVQRGQLGRALEAADRAVAAAPASSRARLLQGRILRLQGLAGEALERFHAVEETGTPGERARALEERVLALLELGRPGAALDATEAMGPGPVRTALRGRAQLLLGEPEQAVRTLSPLAAEERAEPGVLTTLGHALLESGRPADAEPVFRRVLERVPGVAARVGLGRALETLGDRTAAEEEYRRAVQVLPSHGPGVMRLAELEWRSGRRHEAVATLVAFLDLDPTHVDGLVKLGRWLEELGRPEQGERALRRAIALDPGRGAAKRELARLRRQGNA